MKVAEDLTFVREPGTIRPVVGTARGNLGVWLFVAIAVMGAIVLFATLETRREKITAPAIGLSRDPSAGMIASPPELILPPPFRSRSRPEGSIIGERRPELSPSSAATGVDAGSPAASGGRPRRRSGGTANTVPIQYPIVPYSPPPLQAVYDSNAGRPIAVDRSIDSGNQADRVKATQFASPIMTVPKGTIITAVLETALDSTRSGFVRAIVSRDVFGFDGGRVLIPKGSRLVGEYRNDLAPGQNRALIQWQRLMRPDGAIINLDSPAADPLGRAGVRGKVNSHFFERFGGAILQSILSIGSQVAANKISDGAVVYAIPVPTQGLPIGSPDKVQPTLKVRQGTSVSVFVAKDLDFSTVDR